MNETLKTITVGTEDQPSYSYCMGWIDGEAFEKASQAEGWSPNDVETIDNEDKKSLFYHGYVTVGEKGESWFSRELKEGYEKATVREW